MIVIVRLIAVALVLILWMPITDAQDSDRRGGFGGESGGRGDRGRGRRGGGRGGFDPISRLDANRNGVIDQAEVEGISDRFRGFMESRGFQLYAGDSVDDARGRLRQRFEEARRNREQQDNAQVRQPTPPPPPPFKPRDRKRITIDLPNEYANVDSDLDGQVGLYEWIVARRNDLELFDEIDGNRDGLLTPRELVVWDKRKDQAGMASLVVNRRQKLLIIDGNAKAPVTAQSPGSSTRGIERNSGSSRGEGTSGRISRGRGRN
jgi:hypothetical protein